VLVINRVPGSLDPEAMQEARRQNLELAGTIPVDEEIYRYDLAGKPTFHLPRESASVQAARQIFEKYIP
jgi:CO dehydrogenase maturation factor